SLTMLTTNWPTPPSSTGFALRSESFSVPSGLFAGQNMSVIGFEPTAVKNENGARFVVAPSGEIVETNAIGRGTIAPMSSLYRSATSIEAGSMSMGERTGAPGRVRSTDPGSSRGRGQWEGLHRRWEVGSGPRLLRRFRHLSRGERSIGSRWGRALSSSFSLFAR